MYAHCCCCRSLNNMPPRNSGRLNRSSLRRAISRRVALYFKAGGFGRSGFFTFPLPSFARVSRSTPLLRRRKILPRTALRVTQISFEICVAVNPDRHSSINLSVSIMVESVLCCEVGCCGENLRQKPIRKRYCCNAKAECCQPCWKCHFFASRSI